MILMDIFDLSKFIDGTIHYWCDEKKVTGFREFNEKPIKGCLYFLLDYDYHEEESLIKRLKKYQASGIISNQVESLNLEKWKEAKLGVIEVRHIYTSYYLAAEYYRQFFDIPFIEVTGSSGKTTTKEMIGSVLNEEMNALISYENYNAPSGVAYTLFGLNEDIDACVLEVGMKDFGIIDLSSNMVKPTIGIINCIQRAHYVNLGSIDNIIEAKGELLPNIKKDGILIVNGECENCKKLPFETFKGKIYRFGFDREHDIYADNIKYHDLNTTFDAHVFGETLRCKINTFGKYNVSNALAAILVGVLLGVSHKAIIKGLENFKPVHRRQELLEGIRNSIIIHDNFNANPDSTRMLLDELEQIRDERPLILVLGDLERPNSDILEYAKKVHYEIGEKLSTINFDHLIAIGKWSEEYVNGALSKGVNKHKLHHFGSVYAAKGFIKDLIKTNSVIVFKAQMAYIDLKKLVNEVSV